VPPLVELRDIAKSYTEAGIERSVLREVNLGIDAGDFVVLLGRSGSGKSTLLNLISGIDQPSSGQIYFRGQDLQGMSETARTLLRRREIGFVFQAYNLIPTLTVLENLRLPLELNGLADTGGCLALLERLGLADRQHAYPDRLSGGEQQRVAIARAMVHGPALILADEPTGNLDIDTGREVLRLLDDLIKASGKTLIMATHSREVIGLANRLLTIRHDRIVELDCAPD
jgi:putative ABC transport system ATP-binding protein